MRNAATDVLPPGRLEERFEDKRPRYDPAEALAEANRCLYCVDAPCMKACPTSIDVPTFIHKIASGNVKTGIALRPLGPCHFWRRQDPTIHASRTTSRTQ